MWSSVPGSKSTLMDLREREYSFVKQGPFLYSTKLPHLGTYLPSCPLGSKKTPILDSWFSLLPTYCPSLLSPCSAMIASQKALDI